MGILDEAIRAHLELKRQHGADDSELQQLEDDAFGPPQRPGGDVTPAPSEAPTEFMSQPETGGEGEEGAAGDAGPGRREPVEGFVDLQEAPERDVPAQQPEAAGQEPEGVEEEEPEARDDERPPGSPSVEDQPAAEHEAVREIPSGPNTEERHAIADQPTEMFDVEGEFEGEPEAVPADRAAPPDDDLVAEEIGEPRLAPAPDPIDGEDDDEDDFFDEQRLSDELDQALEAPLEDTTESEAVEEEAKESAEPEASDRTEIHEVVEKGDEDHDPLEDTPAFLEESPDDDQLWFEQKPPKDFDFDD